MKIATNPYFNNFSSSAEQELIENLVIESIRQYGIDMMYIARTIGAKDDLLNEDDLPEFNAAYPIEMYIKNVEGFEGEGDFLSNFGIQIRDQITFSVAQRVYANNVVQVANNGLTRPMEGDLLYFPLNQKIFEIKFVEHEVVFYQMGKLQTYDLKCELFEFSNETFNTGNSTIDTLFSAYETTSNSAIANVEFFDDLSDNWTIQKEADEILDFSESNPFSEGGRW